MMRFRGPRHSSHKVSPHVVLLLLWTCLFARASAVFVQFQNCLSAGVINSTLLQWVPLYVDAVFDRADSPHSLDLTFYGNVTGNDFVGRLPPYTDVDYWNNPNKTGGKITNLSETTNKLSTLNQRYHFLTYTPLQTNPSQFCASTSGGTRCPIAPVFNVTSSDTTALRQFAVSNNFNSSYAFASLDATISFLSGDDRLDGNPFDLGCVSVIVTPALGDTLQNVLTYVPIVVLVFVALAVVCAAVFSPWGTTDVFRWTSNWGREHDILRLVTPGFGDCLQYLQFIVLAGSLSLSYPGFFQPVVSSVAWSTLMFNQSFVSGSSGTVNPVDGIYVTNSTYGLENMSQLVGLADAQDIWTGTVIWTLVILAIVIVVCQLGFSIQWLVQKLMKTPAEDLQRKSLPFTGGNMVRVVCNYFLLPLVAFSMFQLVLAGQAKAYITALAVVLIVIILAFAGLILRVILTTKDRSKLFDEFKTVLLYGPLYNTYSDNEAPFALVPALLTFIRGVAIGAVQASGIAQVVLLAICEVVLILTLLAFRPFHRPTSMNAYHIFFASFRLAVVLLSVAFIPGLGVTEGPKGWIGYAILVLHGIVLIFGFFLNAVQRLLEVFARMAGAGGDGGTGDLSRGGFKKVFGVRQLSRRARRRPNLRHSMNSDAAMLVEEGEVKSPQHGGRSRSISATSGILLNQRPNPAERRSTSTHLERINSRDMLDDMSGGTPAEARTMDYFDVTDPARGTSRRPEHSSQPSSGPYYRAPRQRRATGDLMTPGDKSRGSWIDGDMLAWSNDPGSPPGEPGPVEQDGRPYSISPPDQNRGPIPAYLREREGSDTVPSNADRARPNVDYAVREVDFYYGVRGPALNAQPTRKLKTGPADPVGPVSSATGWFKGIFNRKTKESGKGFEVVRSTRAPPQGGYPEPAMSPPIVTEPYRDSPVIPPTDPAAIPGSKTRSSRDSFSEGDDRGLPSPINQEDQVYDTARGASPDLSKRVSRDAPRAGALSQRLTEDTPTLGTGAMDFGSFNVPSRFNSSATSNNPPSRMVSNAMDDSPDYLRGAPASHQVARAITGGAPSVPRRSSKRRSSSTESAKLPAGAMAPRLSTVVDTPVRSNTPADTVASNRMPFSGRGSLGAESALSLSEVPFDDEDDDDEEPAGNSFRLSQTGPNWPIGAVDGRDDSRSPGHSRQTSSGAASSLPISRRLDLQARGGLSRPDSFGTVHTYRASESIRHAHHLDPSTAGGSRNSAAGFGGSSSAHGGSALSLSEGSAAELVFDDGESDDPTVPSVPKRSERRRSSTRHEVYPR